MFVYLDFDGTVVEHDYPRLGEYNPGSLEVISKLMVSGHDVLLNTMRVEFRNGSLENAENYIKNKFLQLNLEHKDMGCTPAKVKVGHWSKEFFKNYDVILIDDILPGMPLRNNIALSRGLMVDFRKVEEDLREWGFITV